MFVKYLLIVIFFKLLWCTLQYNIYKSLDFMSLERCSEEVMKNHLFQNIEHIELLY